MRALTLIVLSAAPIAGCVSWENDRAVVGRDVTIEAISGDARADTPIRDDEPLTMDRSSWEPVRYEVPVDTTAGYPTYRLFDGYLDETARQRGEYPHTGTALELGSTDCWAVAFEAAAAPGWAIAELVAIPVMVFFDPPWQTRHTPSWRYERSADTEAR